jgi:UDP-N-acetylglucosamine 2-epimerase (non-hydrolysing)
MPDRVIDLIAAARPNFMKVAPLHHALRRSAHLRPRLVHTGQHYDENMSGALMRELGLPEPDAHLAVGSGTHAEQTGRVMIAYEKLCSEARPDCVVVVGDVNSTLACTLAAVKLGIRVAHLEAGLRSGDRTMPEEINRLATDAIADILWTPSVDADENLLREGVAPDRILRVGNIMIDALEMSRASIEARQYARELGLHSQRYAVVTLHRPANVDEPAKLEALTDMLVLISRRISLVFPVHPRTRRRLIDFGLWQRIDASPSIRVLDPVTYVEFMSLVFGSAAVITDSGGIQEETTYLGIPCFTLRENTERPITITHGTNRLVKPQDLCESIASVLDAAWPSRGAPELWDGNTAGRVVEDLERRLRTC